MSKKFTPAAWLRMRTSPAAGAGVGSSSNDISDGSQKRWTCQAFMGSRVLVGGSAKGAAKVGLSSYPNISLLEISTPSSGSRNPGTVEKSPSLNT